MFRVYETRCFINGTWFSEVWIDSYYELKHSESINDELILKLVNLMDRKDYCPQLVRADGFQFYESDLIWKSKSYRLIWLIPPDRSYIGVRNAYRRRPK